MDVGVGLGAIVEFVVRIGRKIGMRIPFVSEKRKAAWNVSQNMNEINWAIDERIVKHFEKEIRSLYQKLNQYGFVVPLIDPIRTGKPAYDSTWHEFHLTVLKNLRRMVRYGKFDVEMWNKAISHENNKRIALSSEENTAERIFTKHTPEEIMHAINGPRGSFRLDRDAQRDIERYLGQWMTIDDGVVTNLGYDKGLPWILSSRGKFENYLYFGFNDSRWNDRIKAFKNNERFRAIGKIAQIDRSPFSIYLSECEIVDEGIIYKR